MTLSRSEHEKLERARRALEAAGTPFATATVVRTLDATSAKPGDRALLGADGAVLAGWLGGGCARGAAGRAAREALEAGAPQLVSLRPQELLDDAGVAAGEERDGIRFARNGCPSQGTLDIFVEPVLPLPELLICGAGLVAEALADMAARLDFRVRRPDMAAASPSATSSGAASSAAGPQGAAFDTGGYVVVATQGQGDRAALTAALTSGARHVAFVGSARKFAALSAKIAADAPGLSAALSRVKAPAVLDINAITPEEIALSILAEITALRRSGAGAGAASPAAGAAAPRHDAA